ncbi:MAG: MCE family protein [Archangium gephyra]|uniref:MCE family protein n=1 Tax=Archangium gephyra TaxID=48 RepID=A0A2W5TWC1_9BACT|nr:MAG: MCE family protein [Archangium gephyra]
MSTANITPAEREKRVIIRAGLFIALGLALAGIVVFVIGKERRLFEEQNVYTGAFENVDGLALDSPVRLGGLNVGKVSKISFAPDLGDKRIIVQMEISNRFQERIREDSVARIAGRGVLGDKAIDISLGSPDKAVVANKGELKTGTSGDISSLLKATGEVVDNVVSITRDLRTGVQSYTNDEITNDISQFIRSARNIASEIETGKGAAHTLIYDKRTSDDLKLIISRASEVALRLDGAVTKVDQLLGDIKNGEGSLHALIYDKKVANAVTDLGNAADELAKIIHDAKNSKDGAVYQLVYGDAKTLMADLSQSAADVKAITTKIKAGEGTLGAVINDPTVYEDLKEVLGNIKRNRVLRELVRLSISNGDKIDEAGKQKSPEPKK